MTLTEFLMARIAEDEAMATEAGGPHWPISAENHLALPMVQIPNVNPGRFVPPGSILETAGSIDAQTFHIARHDPERVLRECEAKRRLIDRYVHLAAHAPDDEFGDGDEALLIALRTLAAVYADHPDYRDEWQP